MKFFWKYFKYWWQTSYQQWLQAGNEVLKKISSKPSYLKQLYQVRFDRGNIEVKKIFYQSGNCHNDDTTLAVVVLEQLHLNLSRHS